MSDSWDFKSADTKTETHCYHGYPAMMIPQIARRLIDMYGAHAKNLLDPYCGTGTSLVEANLKGICAVGVDLNPLACLIARAKTANMDPQILDCHLRTFNNLRVAHNFSTPPKSAPLCPGFKNIDFWFKPETKEQLARIKTFIDRVAEPHAKDFFKIAFSETVREVSLTRNGEFKLYRMAQAQIDKFEPDVCGIFASKLARNRKGLAAFVAKRKSGAASTKIYNADSAEGLDMIGDESIDLVVTSPPYGDSRTTVAYGQFSRLANQWLGFEDASRVDCKLMGGTPKDIHRTGFSLLDKTIRQIEAKDPKRARDVFGFYSDYAKSIKNVAAKIKRGGHACYVVGNRRVKDTPLPTDAITRNMFAAQGFRHVATHVRNIPNKRMPSQNSPTNRVGKKATTMTREYIVVIQKL